MPLLEIQTLTKKFGGLIAVNKFDMFIEKGEIVGIIGPNGAGKTTVFNSISGVYRPNSGKVLFKGEDITGISPHGIAKRGLVRTFQTTTVFGNLTVLENIRLGSHMLARIGFFADLFNTPSKQRRERELSDRAVKLADFLGLGGRIHEQAKYLSHGHQRALELAIALGSDPELLMLDEPAAGMSVEETQEMVRLIKQTREKGVTILLVEHDMKVVMDICTRLYVLDFGKKLAEGYPDEIITNTEVIEAYLGLEYKAEC